MERGPVDRNGADQVRAYARQEDTHACLLHEQALATATVETGACIKQVLHCRPLPAPLRQPRQCRQTATESSIYMFILTQF
jgi:hypothetical protein